MILTLILIYIISVLLNIFLYRKSQFVREDYGWLHTVKVLAFIPLFNTITVLLIMVGIIIEKLSKSKFKVSFNKFYNKIFGD